MAARKPKRSSSSAARERGGHSRSGGAALLPPAVVREAGPCVVGIGASAGGFDAINEFLRVMPPDSGLAFVIVQHLSPTQRSLSAELFAKRTAMAVVEAQDGMRVQPNRVHTSPADVYVAIEHGVLRFSRPSEPHGRRLPIDHFFRSLGEDQKERAIGVVFSGTGSDGTLGLRHIIANGGIVLAQTPETARFDGMPRSAIATGLVTHVLPVDKMPELVAAYARHPYAAARETAVAAETETAALRVILDLLRAQHGYNFDGYKQMMLTRRIHRRMGLLHVERVGDYAAQLRKEPREVNALFQDLLIGVTEFFRDPEAWKVLEAEVIQPIVAARTPGEPIRAWVAGAATGEEAYSIAMLLIEKLEEAGKNCPVQVFGTDTNEGALAIARTGLYPAGIAAHVPAKRLARFFTEIKDHHHYQVNKQLRESVVFGVQNLFADPPFSRVDLVACRNLLIYLEPDVQRRVIPLFHFALKPEGCLFLGLAETVAQREDLFKAVSRKWHIYKRIGGAPREYLEWRAGPGESRVGAAAPARPRPAQAPVQAATVAQQTLLERFAPASVLVNTRYEALYFTGRVDRYLLQPRGAPTQDVLALAREGLRSQLRQAIRQAMESDARVEVRDSRVKRDDAFAPVRITVVPTGGSDTFGRLLLVVFQDEPKAPAASRPGAKEAGLVRQLEEELRITRDDLQNNIERLQSTNEELGVSNEEAVSINEELQSMNEELESSKEELQSLNEELNTVNQQLQSKIAEIETANNDLKNLLASSDVATICLDRTLRIKWFTPATREVLSVLLGDIGRPIGDLASPLTGETLLRDARAVLERLSPVQSEVESADGRWFIRRVLPYRTEEERIDGVTVTFTDITEGRRTADAAIEARKVVAATLEERVRQRTGQVRTLAAELALAEERERQAIARDLHDDLGQVLNIVKIKVDTLLKSCREDASRAPLRELSELIAQADRSIRSLTFQISPPVLSELGLVPALQWLAEEMQHSHGLAVEVHDDGEPKPLGQATRSIAFRAVRELLINVAKHAKIGHASVDALSRDGNLVLTVADSGVGFDHALVLGAAVPGFGLISVRERLGFIGGSTEVKSVPGDGTVVILTVPLQLEADRAEAARA